MTERKLYSVLKHGLCLWVFSALTATPVFAGEGNSIAGPEEQCRQGIDAGHILLNPAQLAGHSQKTAEKAESQLTQEQQQKAAKIDSVFNYYHKLGIFSGTVLVAEAGQVIYQKGFGYAHIDTKDRLEPKSNFQLESISKQFTAMCIMMLAEQGKLNYDDNFQKYLPELRYEGITIRHLLWHTSGMPDYIDLMDEQWPLDKLYVNDDVLKVMVQHHPEKLFEPGERYEYSNTGYVLLASIVERVSGVSFKEFVQQNIFDRIGMSSSVIPIGEKDFEEIADRVYGCDATENGRVVENDYDHYNGYGDGGIYSNVMDVFKWNEALYTEKLVKQETLKEAYKPYVLNNGFVGDYGFGWSLSEIDSNKIVAHSGSWVGFRTYILRDITNKHCVIILTNRGNRDALALHKACYNILMNKPYSATISIRIE
jgi:CubicO group peptidase (beta-lactamase class C family)